jgi:hypothetical protein
MSATFALSLSRPEYDLALSVTYRGATLDADLPTLLSSAYQQAFDVLENCLKELDDQGVP